MRRYLAGAGALALAATLSSCAQPRWQSTLVSGNAAGTNSGNGPSLQGIFSADGSKIVFTSQASNFGPTDTVATCSVQTIPPVPSVNCPDVYVRDRSAGTTTLVSVNAAGTNGGNGASMGLAVSPDGTKVVFASLANDLVAGDTDTMYDLYLRDLTTGTTSLLSVDPAGTGSADRSVAAPASFSPDGTKVYFETDATNLVPNDTNNVVDVFERDLTTGTTRLVTWNAAGTASANGKSDSAVLSPDGTKVAFRSTATDLGPASLGAESIYVRDLQSGGIVMASVNDAGEHSTGGWSFAPAFSPDSTKLAFTSNATNLAPGDANADFDAFVHDLTTSTTVLVSVNGAGTGSGNGESLYPVFNADGTKVAFSSLATNLGPADSDALRDVYVRDLTTSTTALASVNRAGTGSGNGYSDRVRFSPVEDKVIFLSTADDLVPEGAPNGGGLFIRDLVANTTAAVSTTPDGSPPDGMLSTMWLGFGENARFSTDGTEILYTTTAGNLGPTDSARDFPSSPLSPDEEDIYIARLPG